MEKHPKPGYLFFTPRAPNGKRLSHLRFRHHLRASEDAQPDPRSKEMQGLGGQMAPNQLQPPAASPPNGASGKNNLPGNPGQKGAGGGVISPQIEVSPNMGSPGQPMYLPSDNGGQEKFFPKREPAGHLGAWLEYGEGQLGGAVGISSKGWEYGAANPVTEPPEKPDPIRPENRRNEWEQYLYDINYLNNNPHPKDVKKPPFDRRKGKTPP